jgi:DNA-binding beta-propeller fold protein YncE
VYFTGTDSSTGSTGVFSVDITDPTHPATPRAVSTGSDLIAPFGIAASADGKTLFVADPAAGTVDGVGLVFSLSTSGGAPAAVSGTAGICPRGLEVAGDQLYVTGRGTDGRAGLFKVGVAGGALSTVASGVPFDEPDAVAVTRDGSTQYVLDASAGSGHSAAILKVTGGAASVFVDHVKVGFPPGIALTPDESMVLVSALDPSLLTDAVYAVGVSDMSMTTSSITASISKFNASAGLHCSRTQVTCVWADSLASGGTVFLLSK